MNPPAGMSAAQQTRQGFRDTTGRYTETPRAEQDRFDTPGNGSTRAVWTTRADAVAAEVTDPMGSFLDDFNIEAIADEVLEYHHRMEVRDGVDVERVNESGFRLKERYHQGTPGGTDAFWKVVEANAGNDTIDRVDNAARLVADDIAGVDEAEDPEWYWDLKESRGDLMDRLVAVCDRDGIRLDVRDQWQELQDAASDLDADDDDYDEYAGDIRVDKGDLLGEALLQVRTTN